MTEASSGSAFPPRTFRFVVQFYNDRPAYFQAVSGLDSDTTSPTTYRRDQRNRPAKTPSHPTLGTLTLHRGLLATDSKLLRWCEQPTTFPVEPSRITIQLLNESGAVATVWTLQNASPAKVEGLFDGTDTERAVEAIELTYESFTVSPT